jgi:diguanylate cyclase (GGDEF)-like protein
MCPQLWHIRRCTHCIPSFKHSSQPAISTGGSKISIERTCEQDGDVRPPYLKQKRFSADAELMDEPHPGRLGPAVAAAWLGALAVLLVAYAVVILGPVGGSAVQDAFGRWAYDAIVLGAAAAVLARAAYLPEERLAWLGLGVGLLLWALGQAYYSVALYYASPAPFPSPSDALFLAFYPATFLALVLLLRSRSARVDSFAWVDGLIGALAVAAVTAALIFPPVLAALGGDTLGVTVSLAYPCADLVLLGLVAGALTTSRWRVHSAWGLIALALILFGAADVVYLSVAGQSTEALNLASIGWPLAFLLLAGAAWLPHAAVEPTRKRSGRSIAAPILLAAAVVCLLAVGNLTPIGAVAVALGVASLLAVLARLGATFFLNMRMLASTEREATTDALTGLLNRRSLVSELERTFSRQDKTTHVLAIFDLDGFKAYNDSFGHTAGDELLRRLGSNMAAAAEPWGKAYRLGGDEFCVLAPIGEAKADVIVKAAEAALSDRGPSFSIRASWGKVELPTEAQTVADALRIADRRMYTQKGQRTDSALSQTRGVLLGLLREREPGLDRHLGNVASLAAEMGRALELEAEDIDVLVRAAEMHDIGKVAVPDEILHKNGPLTDAERELVQKHTLVGERVLAAAPALMQVSKVVRSSHEHWDGGGYPDGLAGTAIPLGSRIILICDSYSAMTGPRPYGPQMTPAEALAEIRHSANRQFDPDLVDLFVAKIAPGAAEAEPGGETRISL